jgi:peptide chain release factor 3
MLLDPLRRKQFAVGLEQLAQEGTVQLYRPPAGRAGDLVLGALGRLQFEVVKYRLESEYGVDVRLEAAPYELARWVSREDGNPLDLDALDDIEGKVVLDVRGRAVVLFDREWALRTAQKFHPELVFAETASGVVVRAA